MSQKKKKLGIKAIKTIVNAGLIDPDEDKLFSFIIEQNDPKYCQQRALELLRENISLAANDIIKVQENLAIVINLIAVARLQYGTTEEN